MIALDPEFVGSLVPPSKLTTTPLDGKSAIEVPFARLPRLQRLRVQGKADETEVADDVGEDVDGHVDPNGRRKDMAEREKMKKRGKGKSLKRYASQSFFFCTPALKTIPGTYESSVKTLLILRWYVFCIDFLTRDSNSFTPSSRSQFGQSLPNRGRRSKEQKLLRLPQVTVKPDGLPHSIDLSGKHDTIMGFSMGLDAYHSFCCPIINCAFVTHHRS